MTDPLQLHSQASADTRETDLHSDVPGVGHAAVSVTPVQRYELLSEIAHGAWESSTAPPTPPWHAKWPSNPAATGVNLQALPFL